MLPISRRGIAVALPIAAIAIITGLPTLMAVPPSPYQPVPVEDFQPVLIPAPPASHEPMGVSTVVLPASPPPRVIPRDLAEQLTRPPVASIHVEFLPPKIGAPVVAKPKPVTKPKPTPVVVKPKPVLAKPKPVVRLHPLPRTKYSPSVAEARAYARARLSATQFDCLDRLWVKESHWNPFDLNRSSGAYGIPQSLPGSKMASAGSDWRTNPITQVKWGLIYIHARYGTPCNAWHHSQLYNWY